MTGEGILRIQDLRFRYPASTYDAVAGVDIDLAAGQVVGLVGPNGSGKSTLIRLVFDLLEMQSGRIHVAGEAHTTRSARRSAIYLPSDGVLPDFLTGREYVRTLARFFGRVITVEKTEDLFDALGMRGRADHLIEEYSHGMRKKIQLVAAFALELPLTVIDETLNGIDLYAAEHCGSVLQASKELGRTTLLCSHDFALLEDVADRVLVMGRGRVLGQVDGEALRRGGLRLGDQVRRLASSGRAHDPR